MDKQRQIDSLEGEVKRLKQALGRREREKEFPEDSEVAAFVAVVAPLLSLDMGLRGQPIKDDEFYRGAARLRTEIKAAMAQPAKHGGIRRIQRHLHRACR